MNQKNRYPQFLKSYLVLLGLLLAFSFGACDQDESSSMQLTENPVDSFTEWFISTDDKKSSLFVKTIGTGDTVVVLHGGFGNDHTGVIKISEGLENKFCFVFYDQRGSSLSYAEKEFISLQNHVEDLETIRKNLGLRKMNLVSHSAGTVLAFEYLKQFPENVEKMTLLGAMHPKSGREDFFTDKEFSSFGRVSIKKKKFNNRTEIDSLIESIGLAGDTLSRKENYVKNHIKYYAGQNIYDIKKWDQLQVPHWNRISASATSQSFDWNYNYTNELNSHPYPITIINGDHDFVVGLSYIWQTTFEGDAPNIDIKIITEAAHLPWIDRPDRFKELFENALTKTN